MKKFISTTVILLSSFIAFAQDNENGMSRDGKIVAFVFLMASLVLAVRAYRASKKN